MAVKLRLSRMGRKKRPFYRIVAVDSRKRRDGAYIERIGHYDPIARPSTLKIDHDAAIKWLQNGAVPSDTVRSLFRRDGVMLRFDMTKRGYDQVKIEEAVKEHQERRDAKLNAKEPPKTAKAEAKPAGEKAPVEEAKETKAAPVEAKEEAKAEEAKETKAAKPKEEKASEAKEAKAAPAEAKADESASGEETASAEAKDTDKDSPKE